MMAVVTDDAEEVESGKGHCLGIGVDIDWLSAVVTSIHPSLDSVSGRCCAWYPPIVP